MWYHYSFRDDDYSLVETSKWTFKMLSILEVFNFEFLDMLLYRYQALILLLVTTWSWMLKL